MSLETEMGREAWQLTILQYLGHTDTVDLNILKSMEKSKI